MSVKIHQHSWRFASRCCDTLNYECSCGESRHRVITPEEAGWCAKWNYLEFSLTKPAGHNVHQVWHKVSRFLERYKKKSGYQLMGLMEKLALKYPTHIILQSADDDYHSSSLICYILHYDKYCWMGVTVLNMPQNAERSDRMFLYPRNLEQTLEIVNRIKDIQTKIRSQEKQFEKDREQSRPVSLDNPIAKQ